MAGRRIRDVLVVAALALTAAAGCADGGGGGGGAAGVYEHPEEGTITLTGDGKGTWEQEGNDEPFAFEWSADGETVTFEVDGEAFDTRLEDGDLVLPPEMISGDEDVTFAKA